jgi:thiamine biosynthesis lipoprotein
MEPLRYSFTHEAMTTSFEVIVCGQEREYARQAAGAVFRELDRIENLLNKYDAGSDVGQVNLLDAGGFVRVGIETLECLEQAVWAHEVSGGLFDPTLGTGFGNLTVERDRFSVGWQAAGKGELDLGGIGKGYAIDKAAEILADWDVADAVLNGGTSTVLARGRPWDMGIGGPWGEKAGLTSVTLKDRALSGSGTDVKGAHIINPKTRRPAERHLAAWAIHPSAAKADALSTAFMMMEVEKITELCREYPEIAACVVQPDGGLIRIGI